MMRVVIDLVLISFRNRAFEGYCFYKETQPGESRAPTNRIAIESTWRAQGLCEWICYRILLKTTRIEPHRAVRELKGSNIGFGIHFLKKFALESPALSNADLLLVLRCFL